MTITLEDVLFILGLRISGRAVTGQHRKDYMSVIQQLLGRDPPNEAAHCGKLSFTWLKEQFGQLPEAPTEFDIQCHTCAYLLALMECTLFSDGSGNYVPAMMLPLLEDFDKTGEYAWGAATLAFLYRQLGNFATKVKTSLSGCLMLLQVWAHDHLIPGRPLPNPDAPTFPCALRWVAGNRAYVDPHHSLAVYRQELDLMCTNQIIWEPYIAMDRTVVAVPILLTARADSLVRSCIIHYHIVEFHPVDRCVRQFGMQQSIPDAPPTWPRVSSQGVGVRDWEAFHEQHIRDWNDRFQRFSFHGGPADDLFASWPSPEFRDWYGTPRAITLT